MSSSIVFALDQASKKTGYAFFTDGKLTSHGVLHSKKKDYMERIVELRVWFVAQLKELTDKGQEFSVAIEEIQLQDNLGGRDVGVTTFKKLAHVQGVLLEVLVANNINYHLVYATQWKKFLGIDGLSRASQKQGAAEYVAKKYPNVDASQQDACDAICIGEYVVASAGQDEYLDWSD